MVKLKKEHNLIQAVREMVAHQRDKKPLFIRKVTLPDAIDMVSETYSVEEVPEKIIRTLTKTTMDKRHKDLNHLMNK